MNFKKCFMKNNINKNIIKEITNLIIDYFKKNKMLILFETNVGDINIITIINK